MISSFDLTKLESLLKDFYKMTGIRITVFDESFQELVSYPEEIAPFCQLIRTDPAGAAECLRCDQHACEFADIFRSAKHSSMKSHGKIMEWALRNMSENCASIRPKNCSLHGQSSRSQRSHHCAASKTTIILLRYSNV